MIEAILLGIALAISIFSKTPLRASFNVFLFFLGMTVSYHLYTIFFSGFNPKNYMMIWYGITGVSPILGFIGWYCKSDKVLSMILSSIIFFVMFHFCFSIGPWYFGFNSILDTIVFIGTCIILYTKPKNLGICMGVGLLLAFMIPLPFFQ